MAKVIKYGEEARKVYLSRLKGVVEYNEWTTMNRPEVIDIHWNTLKELKKELQDKTLNLQCKRKKTTH